MPIWSSNYFVKRFVFGHQFLFLKATGVQQEDEWGLVLWVKSTTVFFLMSPV